VKTVGRMEQAVFEGRVVGWWAKIFDRQRDGKRRQCTYQLTSRGSALLFASRLCHPMTTKRERERERESGRGGRVGDETIFIINSTSKCFDEGHNDETASTAGHLQVQYHNR
jgi:hypothetical protein